MRIHWLIGFLFVVFLQANVVYGNEPKRLALFIANQGYEGSDALKTPISDAKGVADALKKAGFTSFIYTDLTSKAEMDKAFDAFLKLVSGNDIVWFYYAGHGKQEDGKNSLEAVQGEGGMSAQDVMRKLNDKNKDGINIIILDTCRTGANSHSYELKGDLVSVGGGNVMVVFSTKAGESAADKCESINKEKKHSPFANALIEAIHRYHWQPLEDTLQEVGQAVNKKMKECNQQQQVYVYGWVGKPFCLSSCLNTRSITITP
jgi:hypothetical protein